MTDSPLGQAIYPSYEWLSDRVVRYHLPIAAAHPFLVELLEQQAVTCKLAGTDAAANHMAVVFIRLTAFYGHPDFGDDELFEFAEGVVVKMIALTYRELVPDERHVVRAIMREFFGELRPGSASPNVALDDVRRRLGGLLGRL